MGYSSDNAIHTHQRNTAVKVKALNFCHIGDCVAGRRTWPERSDDCSRKACTFNNCITKFPRSKPIYLWYEQGHDTGVLHSTEQIKAYPNLQYPAGQKTAVRLPRTLPKMALCHLALSTQMNKISSIETKRAVF